MIRKQYRASRKETGLCNDLKIEIKLFAGAAVIAGACIFGQFTLSQAQSQTAKAYKLASEHDITGKGRRGYCMDYALALSTKLCSAGIHGRLVFYKWHFLGAAPDDDRQQGAHVFVEYEADGARWIVDNEIDAPLRVGADAGLLHLIYLLGGHPANVEVELCDSLNRLSFF